MYLAITLSAILPRLGLMELFVTILVVGTVTTLLILECWTFPEKQM